MAETPKNFRRISKNASSESVINFLLIALPLHRKTQHNLFSKKDNEGKISTLLARMLNNKLNSDGYRFQFEREPQQKGESAHADFGVYKVVTAVETESCNFFTLEAKRLPTPNGKSSEDSNFVKGTSREMTEYVYGEGYKGGIQRYKENKHGADLPINAMIGYIQENDFEYWHTTINNWINDKAANDSTGFWQETEKLEKKKIAEIAHLYSTHKRLNTTDVALHHFWLDLR